MEVFKRHICNGSSALEFSWIKLCGSVQPVGGSTTLRESHLYSLFISFSTCLSLCLQSSPLRIHLTRTTGRTGPSSPPLQTSRWDRQTGVQTDRHEVVKLDCHVVIFIFRNQNLNQVPPVETKEKFLKTTAATSEWLTCVCFFNQSDRRRRPDGDQSEEDPAGGG